MYIRKLCVIAIFITVISISVSYASLSQNIDVTTAGSVRQANWDIHFKNLVKGDVVGDVIIEEEPKLVNDGTVFSGLNVKFNNITGSVTYYMDIFNNGDLDAVIQDITYPTPVCTASDDYPLEKNTDETSVCSGLNYSLTYTSNDTEVAIGDIISAGESRTLELIFSFVDDTLPINSVTISGLNYNINYVQNK